MPRRGGEALFTPAVRGDLGVPAHAASDALVLAPGPFLPLADADARGLTRPACFSWLRAGGLGVALWVGDGELGLNLRRSDNLQLLK